MYKFIPLYVIEDGLTEELVDEDDLLNQWLSQMFNEEDLENFNSLDLSEVTPKNLIWS